MGASQVRDTYNRSLRRVYGMTLEDRDAILREQGGVCAICEIPLALEDYGAFAVIDHDHETLQVRGVLCHTCNVRLGKMGADIPWISRAVDYLRKPSSHPWRGQKKTPYYPSQRARTEAVAEYEILHDQWHAANAALLQRMDDFERRLSSIEQEAQQ